MARYAIKPKDDIISVAEGQRYRLSVSVKLQEGAKVDPATPGVLLRATLLSERDINYYGGHLHLGAEGISKDPKALKRVISEAGWTRLEGVIRIPRGVKEMKLHVFCWAVSGSVLVDAPKIEKVGEDAPLSPRVE